MSHLTKVGTCFQNLAYLEKALIKLEIPNFKNNELTEPASLIIPQSKNNNVTFNWDGKAFSLSVDSDYWNQDYSVNHFLARITQEYATETIVGESKTHGFKPVKIQQHQNGARTISLQRYNTAL